MDASHDAVVSDADLVTHQLEVVNLVSRKYLYDRAAVSDYRVFLKNTGTAVIEVDALDLVLDLTLTASDDSRPDVQRETRIALSTLSSKAIDPGAIIAATGYYPQSSAIAVGYYTLHLSAQLQSGGTSVSAVHHYAPGEYRAHYSSMLAIDDEYGRGVEPALQIDLATSEFPPLLNRTMWSHYGVTLYADNASSQTYPTAGTDLIHTLTAFVVTAEGNMSGQSFTYTERTPLVIADDELAPGDSVVLDTHIDITRIDEAIKFIEADYDGVSPGSFPLHFCVNAYPLAWADVTFTPNQDCVRWDLTVITAPPTYPLAISELDIPTQLVQYADTSHTEPFSLTLLNSGSLTLDASHVVVVRVRFIPPTDPENRSAYLQANACISVGQNVQPPDDYPCYGDWDGMIAADDGRFAPGEQATLELSLPKIYAAGTTGGENGIHPGTYDVEVGVAVSSGKVFGVLAVDTLTVQTTVTAAP